MGRSHSRHSRLTRAKMPSNMQLLEMDPPQTLQFAKLTTSTITEGRPQIKKILKLTNKSNGHVAFKVKTTAPKSYIVKPSSGTMGPGEATHVDITLTSQPQPGEGGNHRFLVQAHPLDGQREVKREDWISFKKEDIEEQRLNVVLDESGPPGPTADVSRPTSSGEPGGDLQVKYDELVQYTLMLEKQKKKVEADLDEAKNQRLVSGDAGGYSKVQMIVVALIAFLLSYAMKALG